MTPRDERAAPRDWRLWHTAQKSVNSFTIHVMVGAKLHRCPGRRPSGGFTLIELMAVVVIVAILAAIAYPTFIEQIRKSRRAEAASMLSQISQAQERWRANNTAYTTNMAASGINMPTSSAYYDYAIATSPAPTATSYTVVATAARAQAADARCTHLRFVVNAASGISYAASGTVGTANPNQCWNR